MTTYIALLRGINVGRARRVPMVELRRSLEALDYASVRTVLNSGNAVFDAPRGGSRTVAAAIAQAVERRFAFATPVIVHSAGELATIVRENPLSEAAPNPSRLLVAFTMSRSALAKARALLDHGWSPERFAVGSRAAYIWCHRGILQSQVLPALGRLVGEAVTTRNWATVLKLHRLVTGRD